MGLKLRINELNRQKIILGIFLNNVDSLSLFCPTNAAFERSLKLHETEKSPAKINPYFPAKNKEYLVVVKVC